MPLYVPLPGGVPVFINAVTNSSIQQRVTIFRSDGTTRIAQWEGRGDNNTDIGGMNITAGTASFPDIGVVVLVESRWDAPDDTTFVEEDCILFETGEYPQWFITYVNCDDRGAYPGAGSDHDHNDTIIAFTWLASSNFSLLAQDALDRNRDKMKNAFSEILEKRTAGLLSTSKELG